MTLYIYALCDNTGIKYIGKTNNLQRRFKEHKMESFNEKRKSYNTYKSKWFRKYFLQIYYIIIEKCNKNNWEEREVYWINYYKNKVKLVNTSKGGEDIGGHNKLSINQYDLNGVFIKNYISLTDAANKNNINTTDISSCAKGISRSVGKYMWRYHNNNDNFINISPIRQKLKGTNGSERKLLQFTLNNDFVKEWDTITDAAKYYKICISALIRCAKGKQQTSCGYKWKYKKI